MFTTDHMLEYHLQYNHYPPLPVGLAPFARRAIEMANDGDWDEIVEVASDTGTATLVKPDGCEVTAGDLIGDLHLDGFLENDDDALGD